MDQLKANSAASGTLSKVCFVIGPIGKPGSEVRKQSDMLFHSIIEPALANYFVVRADMEHVPGMITDKIIQRILDSELVVADLTHSNPNVFYELGIRHAAAKPTVHMASIDTELPFDNLGYRCIPYDLSDWNSHIRAKAELKGQVDETEKPNFKSTNPVTHAVTVKAFSASANSEQRTIAQLSARLERMESDLRSLAAGRVPIAPSRPFVVPEDFEERRDILRNLADSIERKLGYDLSEDSLDYFADSKAKDPDDYREIMKLATQGEFGSIVDHIEAGY